MSPATAPHTKPAPADEDSDAGPDEVLDLTDRRRVLVRVLFGVDLDSRLVDEVFEIDITDRV